MIFVPFFVNINFNILICVSAHICIHYIFFDPVDSMANKLHKEGTETAGLVCVRQSCRKPPVAEKVKWAVLTLILIPEETKAKHYRAVLLRFYSMRWVLRFCLFNYRATAQALILIHCDSQTQLYRCFLI